MASNKRQHWQCWSSGAGSVCEVHYICFGRAEATASVQRGRRVFHVPRCVILVTSWFPNIWGGRERSVTRSFILFTPNPVGSALVLNATWKVSQQRSLDAHWLRLSLQQPRSVTALDDLLDGPKATDLDLQRLLWPVRVTFLAAMSDFFAIYLGKWQLTFHWTFLSSCAAAFIGVIVSQVVLWWLICARRRRHRRHHYTHCCRNASRRVVPVSFWSRESCQLLLSIDW